jgi:hypothetical protein
MVVGTATGRTDQVTREAVPGRWRCCAPRIRECHLTPLFLERARDSTKGPEHGTEGVGLISFEVASRAASSSCPDRIEMSGSRPVRNVRPASETGHV